MNKDFVHSLLKNSKYYYPLNNVIPLKGGANNQVFKVEFQNNKNAVLIKHYFQHSNDKRKRLDSEFRFLSYAFQKGIRCVPQPLIRFDSNNMALYSFLKARPFILSDMSLLNIKKAIDFFLRLNVDRTVDLYLPQASESCFSIDDYINSVDKRVHKLNDIQSQSVISKDVSIFIRTNLNKKWDHLKIKLSKRKNEFNLEEVDYCISPSDFGFHNALINENNEIFFHDFEYAGWDDPAKMICDFFSQPKIPVPKKHFSLFRDSVSSILKKPKDFNKRIELVFPICLVKWSCIALNIFLDVNKQRRQFAKSVFQEKQQLKLADFFLKQL